MRITNEDRAQNYIKKHRNNKRWLIFAMCVSLFTGTVTLYLLNKPATAMTENGAAQVGLVLETADSDYEMGLIEKMKSDSSESHEDTQVTNTSDEVVTLEVSELGSGDLDKEGTSKTWEDIVEVIPEDEAGAAASSSASSEVASENASTGSSKEAASSSSSSGDLAAASSASSGEAVAASSASSEGDSKDAKDKTTDSKDNKKADKVVVYEDVKDVVLTASYLNAAGESIRDKNVISFENVETLDIANINTDIENYYFIKATVDDKKIVSLEKKTGTAKAIVKEVESKSDSASTGSDTDAASKASSTDEATAETSESAKTEASSEASSAATEASSVETKEEAPKYTYYVAHTADGEEVELKKDTEVIFNYRGTGTKESFEFTNDEYKVKVKLSDPSVLPDGTELKVTTVDKKTEGYNYDAYMEALNKNASKLADVEASDKIEELLDETAVKRNENNTLLFDIAFMLEGVEYELKEGMATVSVEFAEKQMSDGLEASEPEDLAVVHLPIDSEIMEEVDSTSEATEITADDISVVVLENSTVKIEDDSESVSFKTESFSVYALTKTVTRKGQYSWEGPGLNDNSAAGIITSLGDSIYFGVVADYFQASSHYEANLAINRLGPVPGDTVFDFDAHYIHMGEYTKYDISIAKKSSVSGTFKFGLYTSEDGSKNSKISEFTIDANKYNNGWFEGSYKLDNTLKGKTALYVYELDSKGNAVKEGNKNGSFVVTYSGRINNASDMSDILLASYIMNKPDDSKLLSALHPGAKVYYPVNGGYEKAVNVNNTKLDKTKYSGDIPIVPNNLLAQARDVSAALPYAKNSDSVEVLNIVATTGDFKTDVYNALKDKFGWTDANQVQNINKGIRNIASNKLIVFNLDLSKYKGKEYKVTQFFVNGVDSSADWNELDSRIIINPVQLQNNVYVPFSGTLDVTNIMGTVLAPSAKVYENEVNGAIIGKEVYVCNGEIHKYTLISYLNVNGSLVVTNTKTDMPHGTIEKIWDGDVAYAFIYAYVCARTVGGRDIPEYSFLVELNAANGWKKDVTFPADYYGNSSDPNNRIVYRVVEINAFKNGHDAGGGIYSFEELERIVKDNMPGVASNSVMMYDDATKGQSAEVNGYFVSYSTNIEASVLEDVNGGKNRVIYIPGQSGKTLTITNTQKKDVLYDLFVYKYVDNQPAVSGQNFSFTMKFWNSSTRQWEPVYTDLHNGYIRSASGSEVTDPYTIGVRINTSDFNMEAGKDKEYYFLFTENENKEDSYSEDTAKILVKIKYYQDEEPEKNERCYYLYDEASGYYTSIDTNPTGNNDYRKKGKNINDVSTLPVFKNYSRTKVLVNKIWGTDQANSGDYSFDINLALLRKTARDSDYTVVKVETLKAGTRSYEFTDLPAYDSSGNKYEYSVEERFGESAFKLDGDPINGYKLVGFETVVSDDKTEITLTNVPIVVVEKQWTVSGAPVSKEEAKDFGSVWVNVYQAKSKQDPVRVRTAVQLSSANDWKQELVLPYFYKNGKGNYQAFIYSIVECNSKGEEYGELSTITYFTYVADKKYSQGTVGKTTSVWCQNYQPTVLKLMVSNERGGNVLPRTGGSGNRSFLLTGFGFIMAALLGKGIYSKKQKKKV
ncbi:MAG: Cna B-type domain-containing protein [Butyrivibrio sp.]|uniref:Cna B-type domain-containing protein n=1 Tax=Butyrivibrio sp. TaxID=28121 RepID=UPI0025C349D5|nr:Cna B-type domain-containing protein [Butyrivibrio sp.]MBQ6589903.1 Cna B-type domain-containing protein [Butyrivibrio sp.]